MSYNISSKIMDYASGLHITIDTSNFGPRQIGSFHRAAKTGICKGGGAPDLVAKTLRKEKKLPWIHYMNRGHFYWGNIPKDADNFFDRMTAAMVATR